LLSGFGLVPSEVVVFWKTLRRCKLPRLEHPIAEAKAPRVEGNFQVEIFEQGGTFQRVVFNEIGEFEGETTYTASDVGWVDINADGSWILKIE
jgi:hypothetical protein